MFVVQALPTTYIGVVLVASVISTIAPAPQEVPKLSHFSFIRLKGKLRLIWLHKAYKTNETASGTQNGRV